MENHRQDRAEAAACLGVPNDPKSAGKKEEENPARQSKPLT
jgi:hypothetical protein